MRMAVCMGKLDTIWASCSLMRIFRVKPVKYRWQDLSVRDSQTIPCHFALRTSKKKSQRVPAFYAMEVPRIAGKLRLFTTCKSHIFHCSKERRMNYFARHSHTTLIRYSQTQII